MEEHSQSYNFLTSIIDGAPYGIVATDITGKITLINYLGKKYLSVPEEDLDISGDHVFDYSQKLPELHEELRYCFDNNYAPFDIESLSYGENYYTIKARAIEDGLIITIEDVTRIFEMESDILHSMIEGQEHERRRIAKDIHDGLGPLLSTIKVNLETIRSEFSLNNSSIQKFDDILKLIDSLATEMRGISHDLMPKALFDFGLIAVLENMSAKVNESKKLVVTFYHSNVDERLDIDIEVNLYRICQELLNNCLKHSNAEKLSIQLINHKTSLMLTVEDDGSGFDIDKVWEESDGIGLTNVESRVKALGGEFIIDSSPGRGTMISIEVPLKY